MIQTGIRLDESLYERLKINAKKQGRSVNSYIVSILESSSELVFPKIAPEELKPDDFILSLGVMEGIPAESLKSDPKLAYILSK